MLDDVSIIEEVKKNLFVILFFIDQRIEDAFRKGPILLNLLSKDGIILVVICSLALFILLAGTKFERFSFCPFVGALIYTHTERYENVIEYLSKIVGTFLTTELNLPKNIEEKLNITRLVVAIIGVIFFLGIYPFVKFFSALYVSYLLYDYITTNYNITPASLDTMIVIGIVIALFIIYKMMYWIYSVVFSILFALSGSIILISISSSIFKIPPEFQEFLNDIRSLNDLYSVIGTYDAMMVGLLTLIGVFVQSTIFK